MAANSLDILLLQDARRSSLAASKSLPYPIFFRTQARQPTGVGDPFDSHWMPTETGSVFKEVAVGSRTASPAGLDTKTDRFTQGPPRLLGLAVAALATGLCPPSTMGG